MKHGNRPKKFTDNKNSKQKIFLALTTLVFLFLGIFAGIYGIDQIENYYEPYTFGFIFCLLGFAAGHICASLIKPRLKLDRMQLNNFWLPRLYISIGFTGIMLAAGSIINTKFSKISYCDNCDVVGKTIVESRFRSPGANYLFVNINGRTEGLRCKVKYFERLSVGYKINVCVYESKLGFNYISLTNE